MRGQGDETGAGHSVGLLMAVILIVVVVYVALQIFFNTPNPLDMMKMVITEGMDLIYSGIRQSSMSMTTIG